MITPLNQPLTTSITKSLTDEIQVKKNSVDETLMLQGNNKGHEDCYG